MKKLLFIFSVFLLFSCSNKKTLENTNDSVLTLKNQISEKGEKVLWPKRGEENLLTNNIRKNENFTNGTQVNSEALKALSVSGEMGRIAEVFTTNGSMTKNRFNGDLANSTTTNPIYIDKNSNLQTISNVVQGF